MSEIRALTIHQPRATLVALGVKTIETRSRRTSYRGPLAIHAGLHRPALMHLPPLWSVGATRDEQREANERTWTVIDTITDPVHQRPHRPRRAQTPTLFYPRRGPWGRPHLDGIPATEQGTAVYLPLGAVVAVAELVDCVPIGGPTGFSTGLVEGEAPAFGDSDVLVRHPAMPGLSEEALILDRAGGTNEDVSDQLPYGDFRPGRWGWILDHVEPLDEPVPAKGALGLWRWSLPAA